MKTIKLILILLLSSSCYLACKKTDNQPQIPEISTFENVAALEDSVINMYQSLKLVVQRNDFFIQAWAGDDITTFATGKLDFVHVDSRFPDENAHRIILTWNNTYEIIQKANFIIHHGKELDINENELKEMLVGEAYFLRGYLYHHLVRMFGELPLQLGLEIDADAPLSSTLEVYNQIESDFLSAEEALPVIYPNVGVGAWRPNSGSARAFLSRLYLDWAGFPVKDVSKYSLAASSAKQVIDNHTQHGFGLVEDLNDLWTVEHRINKESIFTVEHCDTCEVKNLKYGKVGNPSELGGWFETYAEIKFFEDFPENHRKQATHITDPLLEDPFLETTDPNGATINWAEFNNPHPIFAKITGKGDISREAVGSTRNDYIMRYAEVLLIYAEAMARSGSSAPEAWEALNMVRRRAHLLPFQTTSNEVDITSGDLAELAFTEKGWELAGEFLRWYDLVRLERVAEFLAPENRDNIATPGIDHEFNQIIGSLGTDNYFAPIPRID